ncbi:MAG: cytochrome c peroxidase, partial [Pseudomonadota bacterium]
MAIKTLISLFFGVTVFSFSLFAVDPAIDQLRQEAKNFFSPIPSQMPGADQDTPAKIALGKKLYFDTLLSLNRTQSCNSCHTLDTAYTGTDPDKEQPTS